MSLLVHVMFLYYWYLRKMVCRGPGPVVRDLPYAYIHNPRITSREQHIKLAYRITSSITRILKSYTKWSHDQVLDSCHAGQAIIENTAETDKAHAVEPKSRLHLQAADRETILVRRAIIVVLLLIVVLRG